MDDASLHEEELVYEHFSPAAVLTAAVTLLRPPPDTNTADKFAARRLVTDCRTQGLSSPPAFFIALSTCSKAPTELNQAIAASEPCCRKPHHPTPQARSGS